MNRYGIAVACYQVLQIFCDDKVLHGKAVRFMNKILVSLPCFVILDQVKLPPFCSTEFTDHIGHFPPGTHSNIGIRHLAVCYFGNDDGADALMKLKPAW